MHMSLPALIGSVGYAGLFFIIFAESGLFFGFFFPGDSLLFTAGVLAAEGLLNIAILVPLLALAAILGDSAGYWFGVHVGPTLFSREDSFFFHKRHLERTRDFYASYGTRAVFLARFIPIVRTFTPIFAGIGRMPYSPFLFYNVLGGILWSAGFCAFGYFLGAALPGSQGDLVWISIGIIALSLLPILWQIRRTREKN
ncbi:MAG: VTT domain-containing protein [Patescibacteria group bacterium]|nr:VTT domain-containing protein [Patescibacteria group bacterium]